MRLPTTLVLIFASAAFVKPASAAVVTLDFTGTVYDVDDRGSSSLLDGSVATGTPFHLHVDYDESTLPSETHSSPTDASSRWIFAVPPNQVSFSVGNYLALAGPLGGDPANPDGFVVDLGDGSAGQPDAYAVLGNGPVTGGSGALQATFRVSLYDSTGTAVASTQLASVPFDLASWDPWSANGSWSVGQIIISDDPRSGEAAVTGRIESIAVSRVPEPFAGLLAAAALAALAAVRTLV